MYMSGPTGLVGPCERGWGMVCIVHIYLMKQFPGQKIEEAKPKKKNYIINPIK